jgi:hypothetical protein
MLADDLLPCIDGRFQFTFAQVSGGADGGALRAGAAGA